MVQGALLAALVYYAFNIMDCLLGWQVLVRPIVLGPMVGLVLGDFKTGITMGASLEAIYVGMSWIGGVTPADPASSSVVAIAFAILTHVSPETALTIALPIGAVMARVDSMVTPITGALSGVFDKLAEKGETRKYSILHIATLFCVDYTIHTTLIFMAMAFGMDKMEFVLSGMPEFLLNGLNVAGGMLVAVGFAILTKMIWSKELAVFFFVGFVLAEFLQLPIIAIAILALAVAVVGFSRDRKMKQMEDRLASSGKEDLF